MPEGNETTTPPAGEGAGAATITPPAGATTTPPAGEGAGADSRTAADLAEELKRVNAESAGRRKRIEELERAEADRKKGELSEVERLKTELAERDKNTATLQAKLDAVEARDLVADAAKALGFRNPGLASRLVDLEAVKDDAGKLDKAKIDKALKDALKADPYLGGVKNNDGGNQNHGETGPSSDMNTRIRRAAGARTE